LVLQHFVSNPEGKPQVDHIDGDRANNRVSNLRWATFQENAFNRSPSPHRDLPKGVSQTASGRFRATIHLSGKAIALGVFDTAEQAGEAYRLRAEEEQKDFAYSKRSFEVVF
jgi:hypothetical protein